MQCRMDNTGGMRRERERQIKETNEEKGRVGGDQAKQNKTKQDKSKPRKIGKRNSKENTDIPFIQLYEEGILETQTGDSDFNFNNQTRKKKKIFRHFPKNTEKYQKSKIKTKIKTKTKIKNKK